MTEEKIEQPQKKEEQKHRGVKCNSTLCYFRVKTNRWVCRSCSYIEQLGELNIDGVIKEEKI